MYGATQRLVAFVDCALQLVGAPEPARALLEERLGRRQARRLWDDRSTSLVALTKLTAPFTRMRPKGCTRTSWCAQAFQGAGERPPRDLTPEVDAAAVDERLSRKIETVREFVSLGLQVRTQAKIKGPAAPS